MFSKQKKIWSQEQDALLKRLYEDQNIKNWSMLAKKMEVQFSMPRKSAKQCRERYENHINVDETKIQWTIDEELMLVRYHNEVGNKWSVIAQMITGKTDNCVKNHFYSKLRKILRKLNAIIQIYFRKQFREININTIYKIVEACEEMFKEKPNCDQSISLACREIQNKMLNLSMLKEEEHDSQQRILIYKQVIRQIYSVSKLYKRKSKKNRKNSIITPNIKMKKRQEIIVVANSQQGYQSDPSSAFDDEEDQKSDEMKSQQIQQLKQQQPAEQDYGTKTKHSRRQKGEIIVKDEQQGIKDLLKEVGVLQYENSDVASLNGGLRISSRSSFKSYSDNLNNDSEQQPFFDDSEAQGGYYSKIRKRSYFKNLDDPSQKSDRGD